MNIKTALRRIALGTAAVSASGALAFAGAVPAQAVHTGQKLGSSGNSTTTVKLVELYGGATHTILPGKYVYLASKDVPTAKIEICGDKFRVGNNGNPYGAWQDITGCKRFRFGDSNVIWFDARA